MIIKVQNLKKTYKTYNRGNSFAESVKSLFHRKVINVNALKGIDFTIEKGELVALLGPNGAGKSTALKILTGVLYPTSGDVSVMGYVPWKERKKYVAHIGAVFGQKSQLIWDIPPLDSFCLNRAIYSIPNADFKANLDSMVEMLDVGSIIKKPTRQLSLGERMKCEFIMAILHKPKVVFLDEPTIGLDVIAKDSIRKFIQNMNSTGTTFILTTHDLGDVEQLAKRVIVINKGEIVFDDELKGLRRHIENRKIIRITTREPVSYFGEDGITMIRQISPYEAELGLDVSKMKINEFINMINMNGQIADISIREVPIEEVIKELYVK